MNRAFPLLFAALASAAFFHPDSAGAATITLGTTGNASNWRITGAGASAAPSFQTSVNRTGAITLTSDAVGTGTFVSGGSLAAFNGFWFADETFTLPADATGISLSFDSLYGNDRVVLQLNGTTIGNATNLGTSGAGVMSFSSGADAPFTFTNTTSGTVSSGFVTGLNTLRLIVNNTGVTPITAPTSTFVSPSGDATTAFLNATVTYNVPEPCSPVLLLTGAFLCVRRRLLPRKDRNG